MRLARLILLASCLVLAQLHEGSSFKLTIFGSGVAVGFARALRNVTRGNNDQSPILVRPTEAEEPEVASDYVEYDSGTRFDYNYDYDPIDLNYSYDYGAASDSGSNVSESDANAGDVQANLEDDFSGQSIPDFSGTFGGSDNSAPALIQPVSDFDTDDAVRQEGVAPSADASFSARPVQTEQKIDVNAPLNLTVPDYSSIALQATSEIPPIDLQGIFSGIISFTTEEPQPIYESILSNLDLPETTIENPEYIPDLESEDTFNPKYGLENIEQPQAIISTVAPTSAIAPTEFRPRLPNQPSRAPTVERAKLLVRYSISSPMSGLPPTHFAQRGKSLRAPVSEFSKGTPSKLNSNSRVFENPGTPFPFSRQTSFKNANTPITLVSTSGMRRQVSSRPPSGVERKDLLMPTNIPSRTNQKRVTQPSLTFRTPVGSRDSHQKSTNLPSTSFVNQKIPFRGFSSSFGRTEKQPRVKETLKPRFTPKIPLGSQGRTRVRSQVPNVNLKSIPSAPGTQHMKFTSKPRTILVRKPSHISKESVVSHIGERNASGVRVSNIRKKRTAIDRKIPKSKKLIDGYLPRGVVIDLRHRDRLHEKSDLKDNPKKKNSKPDQNEKPQYFQV